MSLKQECPGPTITKPKDIAMFGSQYDVEEYSDDNERFSLEILGL